MSGDKGAEMAMAHAVWQHHMTGAPCAWAMAQLDIDAAEYLRLLRAHSDAIIRSAELLVTLSAEEHVALLDHDALPMRADNLERWLLTGKGTPYSS